MRELVSHLYPLQRDGLISSWYDGQILPGEEWAPQIKQNLEQAQIILLLISKDFLNSDYCYEIELTKAIERHRAGTASVIPVILRSCLWDQVSIGGFRLSDLQALPKDAKPISQWNDPDDAFTDVAKGLLDRIQQLQWQQEQTRQRAEQQRQAALELQRQQEELERQRQVKIEAERKRQAEQEAKRQQQEQEAAEKRRREAEARRRQQAEAARKRAQPASPAGETTITRQQFLKWAGLGGVGLIAAYGITHVANNPPLIYDYKKLEGLLKAGQWQEADQETLNVILKIANREEEGWLDIESIQNFPCDALEKIDQLWVEASDRKFGFNVQKKIYVEACGGTPDGEYDETAWYCFVDKVGWRVNGDWISYLEATFNTGASSGHLPWPFQWGGWGGVWEGVFLLSWRDL